MGIFFKVTYQLGSWGSTIRGLVETPITQIATLGGPPGLPLHHWKTGGGSLQDSGTCTGLSSTIFEDHTLSPYLR